MLSRMRSPLAAIWRIDAAICSTRELMSSTDLADLQERFLGLLDRRRRRPWSARRRPRRPATARGGLLLDLLDQLGDRGGGLLGFLGEVADLLGDDREPAAVFAGASGLDRGVEREQVGLGGDAGDRLDDPADLI